MQMSPSARYALLACIAAVVAVGCAIRSEAEAAALRERFGGLAARIRTLEELPPAGDEARHLQVMNVRLLTMEQRVFQMEAWAHSGPQGSRPVVVNPQEGRP